MIKIKTALLSVTDKTGLIPLAKALVSRDVKLVSTGGTAKALREAGLPVTPAEELTGNPEAFGGRMKSISFQISSGLLYRRGHPQDEKEAAQLEIPAIDLVVCNLYDFESHVGQNKDEKLLVEEIDIGGPLMIRAAAKNYAAVSVLTDPADYEGFIKKFLAPQGITLDDRRRLASLAFDRIARYDIAIAEELGARFQQERQFLFLSLEKKQRLRYGENSHQEATWYNWRNSLVPGFANVKILQGKELSYNNILDADAAWKILGDVQSLKLESGFHSAAVIKHGNPCGLAYGPEPLKVLSEAWNGDNVSAFGGIVAVSFEVSLAVAEFFGDRFIEILMAPSFSEEAKNYLSKKRNLRLLCLPLRPQEVQEKVLRSFTGGVLLQDEDEKFTSPKDYIQKTKKAFTADQLQLARFGVVACKHLKSNGIALVGKNADVFSLIGTGMGQPNRLDSLRRLAAPRAKEKGYIMSDLILISDAFFPFPDTVEAAAAEGIRLIVQPGGSLRDNEVIAAADREGVAMVFTGERHFRH